MIYNVIRKLFVYKQDIGHVVIFHVVVGVYELVLLLMLFVQ